MMHDLGDNYLYLGYLRVFFNAQIAEHLLVCLSHWFPTRKMKNKNEKMKK